jgi:BirA family biotin operon repressor/biotin-[acetyl-CoA-carboxylase] ligase
MSEPLPPEISAALRATADRRGTFGEVAYFFSDTQSTNDVAAALAERGAPEGAVVIASSQTAGRGRFGRGWFSPPGAGLYVSVVFRDPRAVRF